MLIDTRPTASVTFKKNFDEPIDLRAKALGTAVCSK